MLCPQVYLVIQSISLMKVCLMCLAIVLWQIMWQHLRRLAQIVLV